MTESLEYESAGDVAILRLDDGKANALSPTVLDEITGASTRQKRRAKPSYWRGAQESSRPGSISV